MSQNAQTSRFDTDFGIVTMSVDPSMDVTQVDSGESALENDGECGLTSVFATKKYVIETISAQLETISDAIKDILERLSVIEEKRG